MRPLAAKSRLVCTAAATSQALALILSLRYVARIQNSVVATKDFHMSHEAICCSNLYDTRRHSGQNVVDSPEAQPSESATNFDHCDDAYRYR